MSKIAVYVDHFGGKAAAASWEALTAAQTLAQGLGGEVVAVVLGQGVDALAQEAAARGPKAVLVADDPALAEYVPDAYADTLVALTPAHDIAVWVFPTTMRGRELAGLTAAGLDVGALPDVTDLAVEDGKIVAIRPVYAGKLLAKVETEPPAVVTTRVRAFPAAEAGEATAEIVSVPAQVSDTAQAVKSLGFSQAAGGVSLTEASIIVSGGRGVANTDKVPGDEKEKAQKGFEMLGELARLLGGALGASRAAVDAGYISYDHQVGQTGKVVSPDLYIACGISGAIQHLAGMRTSKVIVAINTDPEAPIFKVARYGVVADLWDVVPELIQVVKERGLAKEQA
ncbi:MAG: electron transfer flavoprotein subunit alpha/FixB family protein [Chloroflexi bacterium]|nr:electron transfer flavoprotein subunit alpha/FixB family protein [Chloroflexota bacterium]